MGNDDSDKDAVAKTLVANSCCPTEGEPGCGRVCQPVRLSVDHLMRLHARIVEGRCRRPTADGMNACRKRGSEGVGRRANQWNRKQEKVPALRCSDPVLATLSRELIKDAVVMRKYALRAAGQ